MFTKLAAAVLALSAPATCSAQTATAWDLGERAEHAPEQLDDFAFLIGCHDAVTRRWDEAAGDWGPGAPARWDGRWALDGWAIYDEWYNVQIPGQPEDLGRGANIRAVDAVSGRWFMTWVHTGGAALVLHAKRRGDVIEMWQVEPHDDFDRKSVFTVGDDGAWVRETQVRLWGTDAWTRTGRLEATKVSCDTRGS